MKLRMGIGALGLLVAIGFPWVISNPAIIMIAVFTLLYAASASAWDLFSGSTGYISLGHGTFFGVGAYTLALLCQVWNVPAGPIPFLLLPLCGLAAWVCAAVTGVVALRVRGQTFVMLTIALFFSFQLLAYNVQGLTHGSTGMDLPIPLWSGAAFTLPFYYVALLLVLLALLVSWIVRTSKYGLGLRAIGDDEGRAQGLGVRTGISTWSAFVLSSMFVGMAGGLYAYFVGSIFPEFAFDPVFNVALPLACLAGGSGTLVGPLLGTLLIVPLQQYLILQFGAIGLDQVVYGLLLILVLLLLPEGIIPSVQRWRSKRQVSSQGARSGASMQEERGTAPDAALIGKDEHS